MLRDGRVDAAVIFRYDDATPDDVRATHLFDDPMYLLSLEPGQALRDYRTMPGLALRTHQAPGIEATAVPPAKPGHPVSTGS
jgi:DNA-binding transcriptional LysR family regulator